MSRLWTFDHEYDGGTLHYFLRWSPSWLYCSMTSWNIRPDPAVPITEVGPSFSCHHSVLMLFLWLAGVLWLGFLCANNVITSNQRYQFVFLACNSRRSKFQQQMAADWFSVHSAPWGFYFYHVCWFGLRRYQNVLFPPNSQYFIKDFLVSSEKRYIH